MPVTSTALTSASTLTFSSWPTAAPSTEPRSSRTKRLGSQSALAGSSTPAEVRRRDRLLLILATWPRWLWLASRRGFSLDLARRQGLLEFAILSSVTPSDAERRTFVAPTRD